MYPYGQVIFVCHALPSLPTPERTEPFWFSMARESPWKAMWPWSLCSASASFMSSHHVEDAVGAGGDIRVEEPGNCLPGLHQNGTPRDGDRTTRCRENGDGQH